MMKKGVLQVTSIVLIMVMVMIGFTGCSKGNASNQQDKETEEKILDVLNNTQVDPSWDPTIGNMVTEVFHKYHITWESTKSSNTYLVKIEGSYSPNPDVPNLSMNGSISYIVNTKDNTCTVKNDPDNLVTIFMEYIVKE